MPSAVVRATESDILPAPPAAVSERAPATASLGHPISRAILSSIRQAHRRIDGHPFFGSLYAPDGLSKIGYLQYLRDREHVLSALDEHLQTFSHDPYCRPLRRSWFGRTDALRRDAHVLGLAIPQASSAACLFATRLHLLAAAANTPALAVHTWIQWMGMLSGGRIIATKCELKFGTAEVLRCEDKAGLRRGEFSRAIDEIPAPDAEMLGQLCAYASESFEKTLDLLDASLAAPEPPDPTARLDVSLPQAGRRASRLLGSDACT